MAEAALHLVDVSTGEKAPATTNAFMERIEELEGDLASAERELRKLRRLVKKLETDTQKARESYGQRETVYNLFAFWQSRAHHPKSKLTADRFDRLKWALDEGYTPRQIALAIAGCAHDPFCTINKNGRTERHDDLTVALKSGKALEQYARKAPRHASTQSQTQTEPHEGSGDAV